MRALFPDEARELGVRDSDWELLVEELVEVLSTQFTCFTSTKVHIEARELGVRDARHVESRCMRTACDRARVC